MEYITQLLNGIGGLGFIVGLIVLYKTGVLKLLLELKSGNGKNGYSKELKEIRDNHLHDISKKLEKMIELQQEALFILRDLRRKNE